MIRFIGKRLLLAVPTIVLVTLFVFVLVELSPADPAAALAGDNPTPQRLVLHAVSRGIRRQPLEQLCELTHLADQSENQRLRIMELSPVAFLGERAHAVSQLDQIRHAASMTRILIALLTR